MTQFSITEAKARLPALVQKALSGEDVVIARGKGPILRLAPVGAQADPVTLSP